MKQLTFKDLMDCDKIPNSYLQQRFLLSRFFSISEEDISNMPVHEFMPLMEEMNKYLEGFSPQSSTDIKKPINFSNMIENRADILDL